MIFKNRGGEGGSATVILCNFLHLVCRITVNSEIFARVLCGGGVSITYEAGMHSKSLNAGQVRRFDGPDLGRKCLQSFLSGRH